MTFLRPTMALALAAVAAAIASSGCTHVYSYYRASDGTVARDVDPTVAFRANASRDLSCAPERVRVFQLYSWPGNRPGSNAVIHPFAPNAIEIAEGCGQRAVYKEDCAPIAVALPPEMASQAEQSGASAKGIFGTLACRHVMISRLAIPLEEPVARWVSPAPPATHSVAPVFEDRAP